MDAPIIGMNRPVAARLSTIIEALWDAAVSSSVRQQATPPTMMNSFLPRRSISGPSARLLISATTGKAAKIHPDSLGERCRSR